MVPMKPESELYIKDNTRNTVIILVILASKMLVAAYYIFVGL